MSDTPDTWTILAMLEWATAYFKKHDVDSPRLSIEWLLADVLNSKRLDLYLAYDRPLSPAELDELRPLVKRRVRHEPLQYITGYADFLDLTLRVTRDVLIPRPETEQLTEIILEQYKNRPEIHFIDIGTGSGCIPIALLNHHPGWKGYAVDVSESALELARENARDILHEGQVEFIHHDIFEWQDLIPGSTLDFVVSNPPYVLPEEKSMLEPQVRQYEPATALFTESYKRLYQTIIEFAESRLGAGGHLFLEVHHEKGVEICDFITGKSGWEGKLLEDFEGNNRFIIASLL